MDRLRELLNTRLERLQDMLSGLTHRDRVLLLGLLGFLLFDGGFAYWRAGDESVPYNSVYVAHTLVMARTKGYEVPEEMLSRSMEYLRNIESYYPSWYSPAVKHTLSSYAVFVRMLQNDVDGGKAAQLFAQYPIDDQSLEALAWLWQVLARDPARSEQVGVIATHFNNRVVETAGMANFITSYDDQAYLMLHSNRRTDAIILDALMALTPGDPVQIMVGEQSITPEQEAELRRGLGLDRPVVERFFLFVLNALRFDFGQSFYHGRPVADVIAERLPATIELSLVALIVALATAIPLGVLAAIRKNSVLDRVATVGSLLGVSLPGFWFGILLIMLFAVHLQILPVSGRIGYDNEVAAITGFLLIDTLLAGDIAAFGDTLRHLILPAITLGLPMTAILMLSLIHI